MDSSPDLSLKLRRGSSDSRDSFYMDFAQGIDSDIEEVDTTVIAKPPTPPKPSHSSSPPIRSHPSSPPKQSQPLSPPIQLQPSSPPIRSHPSSPPIRLHPSSPPKQPEPLPPPIQSQPSSPPIRSHQSSPPKHSQPSSPSIQSQPSSPPNRSQPSSPSIQSQPSSSPKQSQTSSPPIRSQTSSPPIRSQPSSPPVRSQPSSPPIRSQPTSPPKRVQSSPPPLPPTEPSPPPTPPPPPPALESPQPLEVSELPEAEDEVEVLNIADGDTTSNDADDDEEDEKLDSIKEIQNYLPPTPPLPPLPPPHSYSQDSQVATSPSSSPSPPPTPPPCPPLSVAPPVPLPLPPLTLTPPGSPSLTSPMTSFRAHQDQQPHPTGPTTPPDVQSDVDPDVVLSSVAFQIGEDTTEESSTTITTPPSNGFASSSSAVTPVTTTNIVASVNEESLSESEPSLIPPVTSASPTPQHDDSTISDDNRTPVGRQHYRDELQYLAQQAIHSYQSTSPMSSANILIPSESASHCSSPAKSSSRLHSIGSGQHSLNHHQHQYQQHHQHRVTIDEPKLPMSASSTHHHLVTIAGNNDPPSSPGSSQHPLTTTTTTSQTTNITATQTGHLALMYHHHQLTNYPVLPAIKRPPPRSAYHYDPRYTPVQKIKAGDALATLFSALYGKLLVVMGIAFPMAEVISTYIPPSFYEVFYLYLYIGSMLFLFFMYGTLLWGRPKIAMGPTTPSKSKKRDSLSPSDSMDESDTESSNSSDRKVTPPPISARRPSLLAPLGRQHHYGSFYLRMGAVAFGIGSMIYSGLEFGQYFELERDTKCHNVMLALTPATRMAFIFIQMYFIFLNNEQIKVYRHKILARFGLMHMIGTNLAVWLNVLIQETKHEILTFYNPENRTLRISHRLGPRGYTTTDHSSTHLRTTRGLKGPYQIFECRRTNILGTLVQDASPFLFPCTIEYSLICAAILYVMWRSISRPQSQHPIRIESAHSTCKRSPHHYSVDCARAHKGLFVGILILVLTIISLILFFVLISRPEFISLAVTEVTICELFIYATATIATLVGMVQIRHLEYDAARSFQLDDILLVGAQTGSFLYNTFTVIAGHFTLRRDTILILVNALASIVQTACQTMFILDASRRQAVSPEHIRKKPGREIVTFMLVVNLAMWAISTLEKSRAESHPIQLHFYGLWAWTIITHVSMPLAIFYRFHSTVCLCEIWKRAYKLKPTYM